jgi:hypothetical protein
MAKHHPMPPQPERTVTIERDGKTHTGSYTIAGGAVRVSYFGGKAIGGASKATQIGNSSPERIAKLLLAELVAECSK